MILSTNFKTFMVKCENYILISNCTTISFNGENEKKDLIIHLEQIFYQIL